MRVCEPVEEWIEERIEKPVTHWIRKQEQRCQKWPWPLDWLCKLVVEVVKVVERVVKFVRTKVVRQICHLVELVVQLVVGLASLAWQIVKLIVHPVRALRNIWDIVRLTFAGNCPNFKLKPSETLLVISHHGAALTYAENTLQAFDFAVVEEGANALEIDACMTQDGKVIAWHDWDPDDAVSLTRQLGLQPDNLYQPEVPEIGSPWRRPVISLTLDEFRQHYTYTQVAGRSPVFPITEKAELDIPTLAVALAHLRQYEHLRAVFVDVKMPGSDADRAAEMLDQIVEAIPREAHFDVILLVPDKDVLKEMKQCAQERGYRLPFSYDREFPAGLVITIEDFSAIDPAVEMKNDVASIGRPTTATLLPWQTYQRVLQHDLPMWSKIRNLTGKWGAEDLVRWYITWTVNDRAELECLCDLGVSGIITDYVPRLLIIAQAKGRL
jgi:glycerophosphoryl diester phosphodiesterase